MLSAKRMHTKMYLQLFAIAIFTEILFTKVNALLKLTNDEISRIFPVHSFIDPIIFDKDGNIISSYADEQTILRRRRDLRRFEAFSQAENGTKHYNASELNQENFYLNISAFGRNYKIVLTRKENLVAPNARIYEHAAGGVTERLLEADDVYIGYVSNQKDSRVALTNFNGIAGYVRTEDDEFFVEPVENDHITSRRHLIYKTSNQYGKSRKKRSRRGTRRKTYNIEVLVTADYTVVEFHGRDQIQSYLTTLLLIVDEIYQDDSIGQNINIVVMGIALLGREESQNMISHEQPAEDNLASVCSWARRRNSRAGGDETNRADYDHTIFLTRRRFGPIGMEGFAHVNGMCDRLRSCTLNHEDGFSSAFVVAHETGHVLGMVHDGDKNKCGDETSLGSIMAPLVQAGFNRYHWSRCSESELQRHIRSYSCLQNNPHIPDTDLSMDREFPGIYYSLDDQCRFDFGQGYRLCTYYTIANVCELLWCGHDENTMHCKTKKNPPIDGTACGEGRWCFKGYCVWRNDRGGRRHGGWGEWSNYGACSRSCGTGTRSRMRQCDRPRPTLGGRKCIGQSIEYDLCNTGSCPRTHDYRAEQCRHQRDVEVGYRRHTWLPYESRHENLKCELYCQSKETGIIMSMSTPVADGTRCSYDDPYSVCANRQCLQVGCDGVIESGMKEDVCGICGGNGIKDCTRIGKTYKKLVKKLFNSFTKVLSIPYKARHVRIRESALFPHTVLALKNRRTGRLVINNNHTTADDGTESHVVESGIKWSYSQRLGREQIYTVGPLSNEYVVMVMAPQSVRKIKIHYTYSLHSNDAKSKMYHFAVKKWHPCSVTCGRGVKVARYGCMNKVTKQFVRRSHCGKTLPKKLRAPCQEQCSPQLRWQTGRWRQCYSRLCGQRGIKTRAVTCHKQLHNEVGWTVVDASECTHLIAKPTDTKSCTKSICHPEWISDDWSQCSMSCGDGVQRRDVRCMLGGREGEQIKDAGCILPRPPPTRSCSRPACPEPSCEEDENYVICKVPSMKKYCSKTRYRQFCCATCRLYDAELRTGDDTS